MLTTIVLLAVVLFLLDCKNGSYCEIGVFKRLGVFLSSPVSSFGSYHDALFCDSTGLAIEGQLVDGSKVRVFCD